MHTATHLVKRALSGDLARGRTIILVTHHISLCLPIAAYLVELSSGAVLRSGLTSELRERGELEKLVDVDLRLDSLIIYSPAVFEEYQSFLLNMISSIASSGPPD